MKKNKYRKIDDNIEYLDEIGKVYISIILYIKHVLYSRTPSNFRGIEG